MKLDPAQWRGRRVLVTGHTGFKGSWLCLMLGQLGSEVHGIGLDPEPGPAAFDILNVAYRLKSDHRIDIRHASNFAAAVRQIAPEIVIHLAAQSLVNRSYREPASTFETNVMGTINLLEALRRLSSVRAVLVVTSDKVYLNTGAGQAFIEGDALGGHDPYSASKAATEIAVASWRDSFLTELAPLATARAGNVIGGGDFSQDRLVPDLVRAEQIGTILRLRRPEATRPFQHVADVLRGYLLLTQRLLTQPEDTPLAMNFGPTDSEISVSNLIEIWRESTGRACIWSRIEGPIIEEAQRLSLDSTLARTSLSWQPQLNTRQAISRTANWYGYWSSCKNVGAHTDETIEEALA